MLRRSLTVLLTALLVLAPATIALADTTAPEEQPGTATDAAAEPALTALADLVDAIVAALSVEGDATDAVDPSTETAAVTDEERQVWTDLLDDVLEAIKVNSLATLGQALTDEGAGDDDGSLSTDDVDGEDAAAAGNEHGMIVSTVAHCAPRGAGMRGLFDAIVNHGALVSAAATGGSVTLAVPELAGEGADVAVGDTSTVVHELTSVAAAEALCADLETIETAAAVQRELAADGTEADATDADDRDADREARRAEREAERDERSQERADRRAERETERAERRADRDQARAERAEAREGERRDRSERRGQDRGASADRR
jgi:hypothetical protein